MYEPEADSEGDIMPDVAFSSSEGGPKVDANEDSGIPRSGIRADESAWVDRS